MGNPLVSVIVPNYNGAHLLRRCLESLLAQTYEAIEIIVVDGASGDGSQDLARQVRERDQRVRLLPLKQNDGFVGNSNKGLEEAQGDLVALLNNDAQATETWIEEIVRASKISTERAGIFASKILQYTYGAQKQRIESTGDYLQTNGYADSRGIREPDIGQFETSEEVFSASGAAVVFRRELIDEIGYLQPSFWSYLEDVEFALRAHLAGWTCFYVPSARVLHRWGQTGQPSVSHYFIARNTVLMLFLGFPYSLIQRYWIRILTAQLRVARRAYRLRHQVGNAERIRGVFDALKLLPSLREKRKEIQRGQKPGSDEKIDWWLRWGDEQMARRVKFNDRSNLPLYVP